ncbi:MAG: hypothetical protein GEV08_12415 [Acidimicrobiia bacterium]|nr:hypothetical protein [Acidimicrobiia bacterium]
MGAPITDYAAYPGPLPDGCPDGAEAVVGVRYTNGRGGEASDLRKLDLAPGDTLTVHWDDFAPGCTGTDDEPLVAVSLSAYDSPTPEFDMGVDQQLLDGWTACGAGLEPCPPGEGGGYALSLAVPGPAVSQLCNTQMEFVIGLPLAVVGPSGSYYNAVLRNDARPSMGIGATNFPIPDCVPGTSPTTASPPTTTPPTTAPPTTLPEVGPVEVESSQVTAPPEVAPVAVAGVSVRQLPATGAASGNLALAGSALLLAGAALVLVGTPGRRAAHSGGDAHR